MYAAPAGAAAGQPQPQPELLWPLDSQVGTEINSGREPTRSREKSSSSSWSQPQPQSELRVQPQPELKPEPTRQERPQPQPQEFQELLHHIGDAPKLRLQGGGRSLPPRSSVYAPAPAGVIRDVGIKHKAPKPPAAAWGPWFLL